MASEADPNATLRRAIIGMFAAAWLVSFVAGLIRPDYAPPAVLHAMATAIVSWAIGRDMLRRNGGGDDK